jgi:hypothetical protein
LRATASSIKCTFLHQQRWLRLAIKVVAAAAAVAMVAVLRRNSKHVLQLFKVFREGL